MKIWIIKTYYVHHIVCILSLFKVHISYIFLKKKSSFFQVTWKKLDLKLQVQVKSSLNIFKLFGHSSLQCTYSIGVSRAKKVLLLTLTLPTASNKDFPIKLIKIKDLNPIPQLFINSAPVLFHNWTKSKQSQNFCFLDKIEVRLSL